MLTDLQKKVDVIIPVYRPDDKFLRLLSGLAGQTVPVGKLILINTERAYWTEEADAVCQRIEAEQNAVGEVVLRHISAEEFDHAATRRLGVAQSDAPVFVCMTDDAVPENAELLEKLSGAIRETGTSEEGEIAEAYACQLADETASRAERFTRTFNYPAQSFVKGRADLERLGIKTFFASNVCCAYRRDIYDRLGGFCAHAVFNEDMIYASKAVRAGYRIAYCAEARVVHSHNYTGMQQLRRNFDLGMSQAMHPEVFSGLRSEGEGIRLVRETAGQLFHDGHAAELPKLFVQSACKYAGYRLGKCYRKLPFALCLRLSMNRRYLIRHKDELFGKGKRTEEG
ncbi:MAG: glycosyltransferase family 2 protein [Eubacteriales bacterium]|nr:glycosyltransferase family 2 protein [Eubacteriales bacterium]